MDFRSRWVVVTAAVFVSAGLARAATPAPGSSRGKNAVDAPTLAHHIDQAIERSLAAEKVSPSPRASDAEFLRRVYLDLVGHIPPADRVASFLDSSDPQKRERLIDELLASSAYGKHQADIWQALLIPRTTENRILPRDELIGWLEERFNKNQGWDKTVRELLTASGEMNNNGALTYFFGNATPDKLTDNVTRVFLGVQLQCAQCHNHPFTGWKQQEYWGMAAFFTRVRIQGNPVQAIRQGQKVSLSESGRGRALRLSDSAQRTAPKLLQDREVRVRPNQPLRPILADWMTRTDNPFFSKAISNRIWGQLFGRGLVQPVDDMHEANPPTHPELLAELADQLAAHRFDLKYLFRAICLSEAYQRTSKPTDGNEDAAPELYSRMPIKVMSPEQMFDSLTQVVGAPPVRNQPGRTPQQRRLAQTPRMAFVQFFGIEDGAEATEYQGGIPQVLRLMNGPAFSGPQALGRLVKPDDEPERAIETMFLTTLARRPTDHERQRFLRHLGEARGPKRAAYADLLWVLLNSSEFTLNH